jgi:Glucose-6-phosphate dehydrogenase subunit
LEKRVTQVSVAIDTEKVLRDLRDLWTGLGREQEQSGGVIRACAMTLIAVVESGEEAEAVRKLLGAVMHAHPSRALILRMSRGAEPGAEAGARVFAECWKQPGAPSQICAEGIELIADAADPEAAAHMILPLLVPDLPVVLWYYRRFERHDALLRLASKVIVDSKHVEDAPSAIESVRALRSPDRHVADLSWTRLTAWREGVSNAFVCMKPKNGPTAVRIEFGGPLSSGVLYLKRWIERALPAAKVTIENASGEPGSQLGLQAVTLGEVSLTLAGSGALEVRAGDCSARSPLPAATDEALLREELSILGEDPVFETL